MHISGKCRENDTKLGYDLRNRDIAGLYISIAPPLRLAARVEGRAAISAPDWTKRIVRAYEPIITFPIGSQLK